MIKHTSNTLTPFKQKKSNNNNNKQNKKQQQQQQNLVFDMAIIKSEIVVVHVDVIV